MEITILGTSAMVPTKDRNHSGFFLRYKNEGILFDCGEGIQRQFKIAGIKPTKITKILISHWHGDHVLGLPGLLQTIASSEYEGKLELYGPKGTKERVKSMFKAFIFDRELQVEVKEVNKKRFLEKEDYYLEAGELEHTIPTLGYSFVEKDRIRIDKVKLKKLGLVEGPELNNLQPGKTIRQKGKKVKVDDFTYLKKGKKITYISDTRKCDSCVKLAKDADLLISECTYHSKLQDKATEYKHMTSSDAAELANLANAKKLILTHFSQRYKTTEEIREDAEKTFNNVVCAYDFMKIKL